MGRGGGQPVLYTNQYPEALDGSAKARAGKDFVLRHLRHSPGFSFDMPDGGTLASNRVLDLFFHFVFRKSILF
jgi:hypothetical protein